MSRKIRLTSYVSCGGCAAKVGLRDLSQVLDQLPPNPDPRLLVGGNYTDDAGVYKLDEKTALVQTVDFFTPIVDDPASFGKIAAANALSDIYAMGGKPLTALNIVCFPIQVLGVEPLVEILRGGLQKMKEAGVSLVGGHTIDDKEPKYGLAVTGLIDPRKVVTNAGAKVGDKLILTKPLGMGIITTAHKQQKAPEKVVKKAITLMATLNYLPSFLMNKAGANACTDITGFSLLGHAHEMAKNSKVTLHFFSDKVPVLNEAFDLLREGCYPGGSWRNMEFLEDKVFWGQEVKPDMMKVLCDAQTSGGLLISLPASKAEDFVKRLKAEGVIYASIIGEVKRKAQYPLVVT